MRDFLSNFTTFIDELIDQFPAQSALILFRLSIGNDISGDDIMTHVIQHFLPHKQKIKDRDLDFFLKNHKYEKQHIDTFLNIWKSIDEENKQIIWKWVDKFIRLTEKYQKRKVAEAAAAAIDE